MHTGRSSATPPASDFTLFRETATTWAICEIGVASGHAKPPPDRSRPNPPRPARAGGFPGGWCIFATGENRSADLRVFLVTGNPDERRGAMPV